jgi:hypothetical protein
MIAASAAVVASLSLRAPAQAGGLAGGLVRLTAPADPVTATAPQNLPGNNSVIGTPASSDVTQLLQMPDLSARMTREWDQQTEAWKVTCTIKNSGLTDSGSFELSFVTQMEAPHLPNQPATMVPLTRTDFRLQVPAGEEREVYMDVPTTDAHGHRFIIQPTSAVAYIDAYHEVTEADETNNVAMVSLQ